MDFEEWTRWWGQLLTFFWGRIWRSGGAVPRLALSLRQSVPEPHFPAVISRRYGDPYAAPSGEPRATMFQVQTTNVWFTSGSGSFAVFVKVNLNHRSYRVCVGLSMGNSQFGALECVESVAVHHVLKDSFRIMSSFQSQ